MSQLSLQVVELATDQIGENRNSDPCLQIIKEIIKQFNIIIFSLIRIQKLISALEGSVGISDATQSQQ